MKPVVVFDMDGTLLDADNNVIGGEKTLSLLQRLQEGGVGLGICTGRLDHDIVAAGQRFDLHFGDRISQHGAVTVSGSHMSGILLDKAEAHAILAHIEHEPIRIEVNTVSNRYWKTDRDPDFPSELYDSHIIRQDYETLIDCQPVVLFLLIGDAEQLEPIQRYVTDTCVNTKAVMSSASSLEIMSTEVSKGQALSRLYPNARVFAIGDAPNDFDMLRSAERGYLVSDVPCDFAVERKRDIAEALDEIASIVL